MKNLVIVESPSKSKTIEKYLGKDYKVLSSKGHIRDLATSGKFGLGVDLENNYEPDYKVVKGKSKLVTELKKAIKASDYIILATDPDREGEAISWHLKDTLKLDDNYGRVVFNEITEPAIKEAFSKPRDIDINLVRSQESRRILDRMIGFRLSRLMRSKTDGKSAGRVQSVALKIIVDREREIQDFKSEEYWEIDAKFKDFEASLEKYKDKKIKVKNEVEANEIISKLSKAFTIEKIEESDKKKSSKYPFTTSTLTQMASNRLGFTASKTMRIAQKLYEGVDIGEETVGLITYMRTDSIRLSDSFIKETYGYIKGKFGEEYIGYVKKAKKNSNVQDAHEGIRPTSINREPDKLKKYLTTDEFRLYKLIYIRALASLMSDSKLKVTSATLDNNDYKFKCTGSVYVFDGYLKVYNEYESDEDKVLPDLKSYKSNVLVSKEIVKSQHFTEPPARFTEARLIKELEKCGIGRPSTYAKIIDILKERTYVVVDNKKLIPTEIGIDVTDKLQEFFKDIINIKYTADMETDLDNIASGNKIWYELLDKFWKDFEPLIEKAFENMEKEGPKEIGEICPDCGKELVQRRGKYGLFVGCIGYPECKYVKKDEIEVCKCPKCKKGNILEKKSRKGKVFYGCSNYPECEYALWYKPTGEICDKCGGLLVDYKESIICPECSKEEK